MSNDQNFIAALLNWKTFMGKLTQNAHIIGNYLEIVTRDNFDPDTFQAEVFFTDISYEFHWIPIEQINKALQQLLDKGVLLSFDEITVVVDRKIAEKDFPGI